MFNKLNTIIPLALACVFTFPSLVIAAPKLPQIQSKAVILMDEKSYEPLFQKNATKRYSPASTTKLMTALLVLENGDLDDKFTVSAEDLDLYGGYETDYIYAGEQFTIEELLYALLVQSANATGNTLARYIDGTTEKFALHMTARAKELGCTNTNFTNPYGKTHHKHYCSAQDLCIIVKEAMRYPIIRKIIHTKYHSLPSTSVYKHDDRVLWNTNSMLYADNPYYDARVYGGKTGYTNSAGRCLVTLAKEGNQRLYTVVLGGGRRNGEDYRYTDTQKLIDYGFSALKEQTSKAPEKAASRLKRKVLNSESKR